MLDTIDHLNNIGPGLALNIQMMAGVLFIQAASRLFSAALKGLGNLLNPNRRAIIIGHDQRTIILAS